MPIEVEIDGHGTLEFPDGTAPEVIRSTVKRITGGGTPAPDAPKEERTWTDTALDLLPLAGGVAGGIVGAPTGAGAIGTAALGGAGGQALKGLLQGLLGKRDVSNDTPLSVAKEIGAEGVKQGAGQAIGMGVGKAVTSAGRGLVRASFGAQKALRSKFPTVDIEGAAIREGVGPGNTAKAARLSKAANEAIDRVASELDAAGAAPVQPREMARGLRPLYERAKTAKFDDDAAQVLDEAKRIRRAFRSGQSLKDANVTRQEYQSRSRGVLQGAADPRAASTGKKISGAVSRSMSRAQRARGMGPALDKSQEMMALNKIAESSEQLTPMLRFLLPASGAGTGYASGGDVGTALKGAAAGYALTNPSVLFHSGRTLARAGKPTGELARVIAMLLAEESEK